MRNYFRKFSQTQIRQYFDRNLNLIFNRGNCQKIEIYTYEQVYNDILFDGVQTFRVLGNKWYLRLPHKNKRKFTSAQIRQYFDRNLNIIFNRRNCLKLEKDKYDREFIDALVFELKSMRPLGNRWYLRLPRKIKQQ